MARVVALIPDLLFGSRVQGALTAAGHDVQLLADEARLEQLLAKSGGANVAVVIIDLTGPELDPAGVIAAVGAAELDPPPRTLGFYSHVDVAARERAKRAGVELLVPRSRMAREGGELVAGLARG